MTARDRLLLVTGATGAIGPAMVAAALAHGWRVRALARHGPPARLFSRDVDARAGDLRNDDVRQSVLDGADSVIHLAASLHVTSASAQASTDYQSLNVAATAALARDAVAAGVRRIVFFSTISVYGDTNGRIATESTPLVPRTPYARSKVAAEVTLREACDSTSCAATILRPAAVYGPRVKGNYRTMLERLARGQAFPVLPGSNRRSLIFVDDLASAALLAIDDPRAAGQTFNVTDGQFHTVAEIVGAMCAALGRGMPRFGVPSSAAAAMVKMSRPLLRGRLANISALVDKFVEDVTVDGSALQRELGFRPSVDLHEGWRRAVADAGLAP
jgi:UDP-glucose 4-epimerase